MKTKSQTFFLFALGQQFRIFVEDKTGKILKILRNQGQVDVEVLAEKFNVTSQTIRRDLSELCDKGLATRTHGGAKRFISAMSQKYEDRRQLFQTEKELVGSLASSIIPDDCSLIINIGTTTECVARALTAHKRLLVISNNINVIDILSGTDSKELIVVGGTVRQSDGAIVGESAVDFISRFKVDYAVIGASAIDVDGSILDFDTREVAVARTILKNARTKILVSDHSKFEKTAPVRICNVGDLNYVVLDKEPPKKFLQIAKQSNTQILIPKIHERT